MSRQFRKRAALSALLCALLLSLAAPAAAEDGTVRIRSAEEFRAFVQNCSYDAWSRGKTVVLERNISLSGASDLPAASFGGTFEGNGYTISGLEISAGVAPAGLFGIIAPGGVVQNLHVEGTVAPEGSGAGVGGIVGVNRGTVRSCSFSGSVSGTERTGGIAGENAFGGTLAGCEVSGGVFAMQMTGGIAGSNSGTVSACVSRAYVNTNTLDPTITLSELNLDLRDALRRLASPDTFNVVTDSGGIAGWSDGAIFGCSNYGTVGYQHIGYNVGGIAGRSSGQMTDCRNYGSVYGRKDIGGIVGVAEPYVKLNLTESSTDAVRSQLSALSALVDRAAADAAGSSGTISARLSAIGGSVSGAQQSARAVASGIAGAAGEDISEFNRGSEILSASLPTLRLAAQSLAAASDAMGLALTQLDAAAQALTGSESAAALRRAFSALSSAAGALDEGSRQIQSAADTLRGTVRPVDGMSETEWEARIFGTKGEDGAFTGGALEQAQEGIRTASSGAAEAAGALSALEAGLRDGSITTLQGAFDTLERSGMDQALSDLEDGTRAVSTAMQTISDCTQFDSEAARNGFTQLKGALDDLVQGPNRDGSGVFYFLRQAFTALGAAADSASLPREELQTATQALTDAAGDTGDALRALDALLGDLSGNAPLHLDAVSAETSADADALYASLRDLSDQLEALNGESRAASDQLLQDIRGINSQFSLVMQTLLGVLDDSRDLSSEDLITDTSDEDIDAVTAGKLLRCVNAGLVSGDIDVGGVAGAMLVYNALNPEADAPQSVSSFIHRSYELKCILQDCSSSGAVSAKRNCAAAICGDAQLGIITGCLAYGSAASESGDYVGGIAGRADCILRACWARCTLQGRKYLGGIVGSGAEDASHLRVERCRSMVDIPGAGQYSGAISGTDLGEYSENLFVSDVLAGLNRASIQGQAEPIDYAGLLAQEGLPAAFRSFVLRFVADGREVSSRTFHYGGSFDADSFPAVPAKADCYGVWDQGSLENLHFDRTVNAQYYPSVTALASAVTRIDGRAVFFASGSYTDRDSLTAAPTILHFAPERGTLRRAIRATGTTLLEQWTLQVPDDGAQTHEIRFLPPRAVHGQLELYRAVGDGWERITAQPVGSYLCFSLAPGETDLSLISVSIPWWVWLAAGVLQLALIGFVIALLVRRKARPAQTEEEQKKAMAFRRRKTAVLITLLVLIAALGTAGVLWLRTSDFTRNQELSLLLRSFAERRDTDMDLTLTVEGGETDVRAEIPMFTTQCAGSRLSCARWQDIPLYYCDGTLLLENGKACDAADAPPDGTLLLSAAAGLFRTLDIAVSEENDARIFRAAADSPQAIAAITDCLPAFVTAAPPEMLALELVVRDGEIERLVVRWGTEGQAVRASVELAGTQREHTVPLGVQNAIASGAYQNAAAYDPRLPALLRAWCALCAADPVGADVALQVNCGPAQMDESMHWQRTRQYGPELNCMTRLGTALYWTDSAACDGTGAAFAMNGTVFTRQSELLRMACAAVLQGDASDEQTPEGTEVSVALDGEAMDRFARIIASDADLAQTTFRDGSVTLVLQGDTLTQLTVKCSGTVRIVRRDVAANLSALFRFDAPGPFPVLSGAVETALGLH